VNRVGGLGIRFRAFGWAFPHRPNVGSTVHGIDPSAAGTLTVATAEVADMPLLSMAVTVIAWPPGARVTVRGLPVPMGEPLSDHWKVKSPVPPVAVAVQVTVPSPLTMPHEAITETVPLSPTAMGTAAEVAELPLASVAVVVMR
jgi:hypothetical protein